MAQDIAVARAVPNEDSCTPSGAALLQVTSTESGAFAMRRIALLAVVTLGTGYLTQANAQARPGGGRDRGLVELQPAGVRGGFYAGLGLGDGMEQYKFAGDTFTSRIGKPSLSIRLGGTASEQLRLGAELFGWSNPINDAVTNSENFGVVLMSAQYFPAARSGFYLKGGAGFATSGVSYADGSSTNETGFGFGLGAGYEYQASRGISVGPTLDWYQGSFSRRGDATLTERVINIGVSVTFQRGGQRRGR
jgi:hypothetical protein